MRKFVTSSGIAAALLLAWMLAAPQASARGNYGWNGDYVGNEWIGSQMRKERSAGEDAPQKKKKRVRTASLSAADDDAAPKKSGKKRRSVSAGESSGGGGVFQTGIASYYWQPQRVASGGWFNPNAMTAAHKTLPFGTRVRVTHRKTGASVTVTINDRGPYIAGRVIDLSLAAAGVIGMKGSGLAPVEIAVLGR